MELFCGKNKDESQKAFNVYHMPANLLKEENQTASKAAEDVSGILPSDSTEAARGDVD